MMQTAERRGRVVISDVRPAVDCGKYPIKRSTGESVVVEADVFADGHDAVSCVLLYRRDDAAEWSELPMKMLPNDRWQGEFTVREPGRYRYTVEGWVDAFQSWRRDLIKRIQAGQNVSDRVAGGRAPRGGRRREGLWSGRGTITGLGPCAGRGCRAGRRAGRGDSAESHCAIRIAAWRRAMGGNSWSPSTGPRPASAPGTRSSPAPARQSRRPRHLPGLRGPAALHRLDGLRRPVSAADSPHRPAVSQGQEQYRPRRSRTT